MPIHEPRYSSYYIEFMHRTSNFMKRKRNITKNSIHRTSNFMKRKRNITKTLNTQDIKFHEKNRNITNVNICSGIIRDICTQQLYARAIVLSMFVHYMSLNYTEMLEI